MQIKIEIKKLKELVAAFETAPKTTQKYIRLALKKSLQAIQIRARQEHRFRSKTGDVERSITTEIFTAGLSGRVFLDSAITKTKSGLPYSFFIHEGTKAHMIRPVNRKWLRWPVEGGFAFAKKVLHPGTRPDPFLYQAAEKEEPNINDIFDRHINKALDELSRWRGKI